MELWPHQKLGVEQALAAIARGERRICVTTPTGGGKTEQMRCLIRHYAEQNKKVAVYSNRKLLTDQLSREMGKGGIDHGIRAAGYVDEREFDVQVCSVMTEHSRRKKWKLHDADLAIVDEAHVQKGKVAQKILDAHHENGAAIVGFTATPIGIGDMYDSLIVAGTNSELRACGALIPALHYGPDEPDLKHIGKVALGEDLTEKQNVKAMMVPGIFARVLEWYLKLNPEHKPTILFAPGVKESLWFAEQFHAAGISAAHIDGEEVWINGTIERSSKQIRDDALGGSKDGSIRVLCNRFVLREGIDAPWLGHGIFATVFGSLQSYLQSGGRLLRNHPGMESVTVQDHGGNWWRHGSLNADREWQLEYTANMVSGLREEKLRKKREVEPARCPKCAAILCGLRCRCGFELTSTKKSRPVVQASGELREMGGDIYRPRRISHDPRGPDIWERMYHRSKTEKGDKTFRQAMALFAYENNWAWPDPSWPLMPTSAADEFKRVGDVPLERLVPKSR